MIEKFAGISVPGPTKTPLTEPFWEAAEKGVLTTQKCGSCGSHVFYPRGRCPYCWSDQLDWVQVSGRGKLKSYSEVWKPGNEGWVPAAPYIVGLVTLEEGPTLLSTILCDEPPAIGEQISFVPFNIGGSGPALFPQFHEGGGQNDGIRRQRRLGGCDKRQTENRRLDRAQARHAGARHPRLHRDDRRPQSGAL